MYGYDNRISGLEKGYTKTKPFIGRIKSVIHKAAQAQSLVGGSLVDGAVGPGCKSVGRCAMGELLFAIGFTNKQLRQMDEGGRWDQKTYQKLWDAYRIDTDDVSTIIGANDGVGGCEVGDFVERERALMSRLNGMNESRYRINPYLMELDADGDAYRIMPVKPSASDRKVLKAYGVLDFINQSPAFYEDARYLDEYRG